MPLPDPVIVVPGITANYLRDEYPLPPEDVWTVLSQDYDRAALHPEDLRYEAAEPARVRPGQVFEIAYRELIDALRHDLSPDADRPVPVFAFAYDWRQPLDEIEAQLGAFVQEVIARTAIIPHYARDGYRARGTVNLLGHSMGGLVIAGYIERARMSAHVHKVATLATPYRGSFEAVLKITTGTANLGASPPSTREREAARLTPALYYLLPEVPNGVTADPGLPTSLYDPGAWQASVTGSIAEYIRRHGTDPTDIAGQADRLFRTLLRTARSHRERLDGLRLAQVGLRPEDWLCVVGVNAETRVRLQIVRLPDGTPDFRFHSEDRANQWNDPVTANRVFTGDGTVPFDGALPGFLKPENLVCVTPDDYGYWEVLDQMKVMIGGFHGLMANMDMLHRLVVRHFTGAADGHENTWGRRAPGVASWEPPLPLREKVP